MRNRPLISVPITLLSILRVCMAVEVRLSTDPVSVAAWATWPALRRLMVEFGDEVRFTLRMGGLARSFEGRQQELFAEWLDAADRSGMPVDPRLWTESPLGSSYPACMAVKAAQDQDRGLALFRALQEG